ncbi:hypothetical protein SAMN04488023_101209 [Pedobacter rhizosphaerae]|uniref:Uncharacterized protein n=1 Tax=Pedobacter rhizosphaerae TaxID=390241 RepID=A0A1H9J3L9_9SPHI|nr:hypothetical protein SAMN04488023_101209 [Pedobacter rhizosphaerae]
MEDGLFFSVKNLVFSVVKRAALTNLLKSIQNNQSVNISTKYVNLSLLIKFMYFCNPKIFL